MTVYLDSSVLLRLVLGEPGRLENWRGFKTHVTSELAEVECLRTLDRLRLRYALSGEEITERREALFQLLQAIHLVGLTLPVLRRASSPFPVALGTLDAIHLATSLEWLDEKGGSLVFATHDRTLGQAARASGMQVAG